MLKNSKQTNTISETFSQLKNNNNHVYKSVVAFLIM